jgi:hypothetical protein
MVPFTDVDMEYSDSEIHTVVTNISSHTDPLLVEEIMAVELNDRETTNNSRTYVSHYFNKNMYRGIWDMLQSYNNDVNNMHITYPSSDVLTTNPKEEIQTRGYEKQVIGGIGAVPVPAEIKKISTYEDIANSTSTIKEQNLTQEIFSSSESNRNSSSHMIMIDKKVLEPVESFEIIRNKTQTLPSDFHNILTSALDTFSVKNKSNIQNSLDVINDSNNVPTEGKYVTSVNNIIEDPSNNIQIQNETAQEFSAEAYDNSTDALQEQLLATSIDENHELVKETGTQNHTFQIPGNIIHNNPALCLEEEIKMDQSSSSAVGTEHSEEQILNLISKQNQEEAIQNPLSEKEVKSDFVFSSALQSLNTLWGAILFK